MKRSFAAVAGTPLAAPWRARALGSVRALSTGAVAPNIQHSDLSYRAMLRNLRLLKGLRGDKAQFNVVITGANADQVAAAMRRLEPALNFEIAGDSMSADLGAWAAAGCGGRAARWTRAAVAAQAPAQWRVDRSHPRPPRPAPLTAAAAAPQATWRTSRRTRWTA
jgi:hypothetical protein